MKDDIKKTWINIWVATNLNGETHIFFAKPTYNGETGEWVTWPYTFLYIGKDNFSGRGLYRRGLLLLEPNDSREDEYYLYKTSDRDIHYKFQGMTAFSTFLPNKVMYMIKESWKHYYMTLKVL